MGLAQWMTHLPEFLEVERRSATVEGHRMSYWKAGTGPALLLLHGLVGTAEAWRPMAPSLAAGSTIYAIDALSIGESERVPGIDPGLEAQAARVAGWMRQVGIQAADILATSHGGAVALMLAARHPERVRSLILQAPANPFSGLANPLIRFYQSGLGRWAGHRIPEMPRPLAAMALGRMYGDRKAGRRGSPETYLKSLRVPGTIDYVLRLLGGWFDDMRDLEPALSGLRRIPALLVWGERDRAVSFESGLRLRRCFDRSELVVLPGAGHVPYEECPAAFSQVVESFLSRERAERESGSTLRKHA